MSIKNESVTPYIPYGPATGVPTPERKNQVLGTGNNDKYNNDVTPGTSNYVQVGYVPYGPATGVPSPEPHNKALGTDHYTGDVTPGTSNYVQVGHIPGGPGHKDCDHE